MDLNYDIQRECSLRTMTMVTIASGVLESSGLVPNFKKPLTDIASEAANKVDCLELPAVLKTDMKGLIRPMIIDICEWYIEYTFSLRPVLTRYGTVDLNKSILAIQLLTGDSDDVINMNIHKFRNVEHLTENDYIELFDIACFRHDFSALKLWIDRVPQNMIIYCIQNHVFNLRYVWQDLWFSVHNEPNQLAQTASICLLLFSKMDKKDQMILPAQLSMTILISLLKLPYQHLFMETAQTMTKHLSDNMCGMVAMIILAKAISGYTDHDYRKLFAKFWILITAQRQCFRLSDVAAFLLATLLRSLQDETLTTLVDTDSHGWMGAMDAGSKESHYHLRYQTETRLFEDVESRLKHLNVYGIQLARRQRLRRMGISIEKVEM